MANLLEVGQTEAVTTLLRSGWSQRRIARELGINRETVAKYARLAGVGPNPAISTPGSAGRRSLCEPLREAISGKVAAGLSAQRIWQDLRFEQGFAGAYQSVKRFVRTLCQTSALPFRRMESRCSRSR